MESVEVNISYEPKEIKRAISFYLLHLNKLKIYAFIVYPIVLGFIAVSLVSVTYAALAPVFALGAWILYYMYYQRLIQAYLHYYSKRKGATYRFAGDKVYIIGEEVQSKCLWSVFKSAYEIPSAFLLIDENKFIHVFSKLCFTDALSQERLRALFEAKYSGFQVF